jgi:serine/threonine-protein kinase SRPK3
MIISSQYLKTFELVTGRTLFEADFNDKLLIPQFEKVIGRLPEDWITEALENGLINERPDGLSLPCPEIRSS